MVSVVLGAQWGDEGKGKLIDILADQYDVIVRATGGANAGHTIYLEKGKKVVFHLIPSGIFHKRTVCAMGNGMVIHFPALFEEIAALQSYGVKIKNRLFLSPKAHIVFEYHKLIDKLSEEQKGKSKIGTTKRGIGPAYADKINRIGIRAEELSNFQSFTEHYLQNVKLLKKIHGLKNYDTESELRFFKKHRSKIMNLFIDVSLFLHQTRRKGKSILVEGANGTLLDIDHGSYPFVTSSNASIGGVLAGCGLAPFSLKNIIGIFKAYVTRVGSGPFPTELRGEQGNQIREKGGEYGATTGRPRRCGWFDAVAAAYSVMINGINTVNLTKLDVLTGIPKLKIGISYIYKGRKLASFPSSSKILQECKVQYLELPGWKEDITGIVSFAKLPKNCRRYVKTIEKLIKTPIKFIGTGLTRQEMIIR